jgi:uncharacterized membrane protein
MPVARIAHVAMATSLVALAILLGAWIAYLSPPQNEALIAPLLLLLVLPLVVPLRGLLHGRRYTAAWVSLLSLFYFALGVAQIPDPAPVRWLASACTVLSLLLFVSTVAYVRLTRAPKTDINQGQAPGEQRES